MGRQQVRTGVTDESPAVNARVHVVYEAARRAVGNETERVVLPTRIEDVLLVGRGPYARFVVSAPVDPGEAPRPDPDVVCMVEWTSERGLWVLPTRYAGLEQGANGTRFWLLDQTGGPVRSQRRQYVRVEWAVPVAVVLRDGEEATADPTDPTHDPTHDPTPGRRPMLGRTRDVSEGGVACLLDGPVLTPGTSVRAVIGVADDPVEADGHVVNSTPTDTEGLTLTVVAFDDPSTVGDRLRPLLFEEQRRLRRLAVG